MTAELSSAINNEEWIVVTGWTPHWKFAEWDLEFLEDPELVYGEAERIEALSRRGFSEDAPEVAELVANMYLTDEQLGELMGMIDETGDEEGSAREWIEDNRDVVEEWIPE